MVALANSL
jgi:hypothetical protein